MVALDWLRRYWAWGVLILGLWHCWMLYLAHYRVPGRPEPEDPSSLNGSQGHEFPGGIRETDLPVPLMLKVFYLILGMWAVAYLFWMRFRVGSY